MNEVTETIYQCKGMRSQHINRKKLGPKTRQQLTVTCGKSGEQPWLSEWGITVMLDIELYFSIFSYHIK